MDFIFFTEPQGLAWQRVGFHSSIEQQGLAWQRDGYFPLEPQGLAWQLEGYPVAPGCLFLFVMGILTNLILTTSGFTYFLTLCCGGARSGSY